MNPIAPLDSQVPLTFSFYGMAVANTGEKLFVFSDRKDIHANSYGLSLSGQVFELKFSRQYPKYN